LENPHWLCARIGSINRSPLSRPAATLSPAWGGGRGGRSWNGRSRCRLLRGSRLAPEADEVIKLEHVGPGLDVFAGLGESGDVLGEEHQRLPSLSGPRRSM